MELKCIAAVVALAAVSIVTTTASSVAPSRGREYGRFLLSQSFRFRRHELTSFPAAASDTALRRDPSDLADPPIPTGTFEFDDSFIQVENPWPEYMVTKKFTYTVSIEPAPTFTSGTSTSSPSSVPDPSSDSLWEYAASHGCRLFDAMRSQEHEAGQLYNPQRESVQSAHMSFETDLQGWGWVANEVVGGNFTDIDGGKDTPDSGWGIGKALRSLGLSDRIMSQGGKIRIIDAIHGQAPFTGSYKIDGKSYPQTGAEFRIGVNTEQGVLMAMSRISPVSAGEKRSPPILKDRLPAIGTFSDIGFLIFQHILGKAPSDFKYMISVSITNEKTKSIIAKAVNATGRNLGPWPGETFSWNSKEFKALLGSPNGMGFGHLLAQHKSQVGSLVIDQIQVFSGETWHKLPNMVFHIKKYDGMSPPNKVSGDPPMMEETPAPSKRRGRAAPAETMVHVRDAKHIVRRHVFRAEL